MKQIIRAKAPPYKSVLPVGIRLEAGAVCAYDPRGQVLAMLHEAAIKRRSLS